MRKKFLIIYTLCLALSLNAGAHAQEADFLSALQDVPLMAGLEELSDQTLVFDKPEGRIVESLALIKDVPENDVRMFYAETLPQLGWANTGPNIYVRRDEILQLEFERHDGRRFMRVTVSPNHARAPSLKK